MSGTLLSVANYDEEILEASDNWVTFMIIHVNASDDSDKIFKHRTIWTKY